MPEEFDEEPPGSADQNTAFPQISRRLRSEPGRPAAARPATGNLAQEIEEWFRQYAERVCPPGSVPTPSQVQDANLFARLFKWISDNPNRPLPPPADIPPPDERLQQQLMMERQARIETSEELSRARREVGRLSRLVYERPGPDANPFEQLGQAQVDRAYSRGGGGPIESSAPRMPNAIPQDAYSHTGVRVANHPYLSTPQRRSDVLGGGWVLQVRRGPGTEWATLENPDAALHSGDWVRCITPARWFPRTRDEAQAQEMAALPSPLIRLRPMTPAEIELQPFFLPMLHQILVDVLRDRARARYPQPVEELAMNMIMNPQTEGQNRQVAECKEMAHRSIKVLLNFGVISPSSLNVREPDPALGLSRPEPPTAAQRRRSLASWINANPRAG
ncbi:MAG: hypothetical protein EHM78_02300 [Myxococcaceae bacterium]|nr:MAG: hypothetical protein EHM78_02300 [Myxococcaceae bacterium]